MLHRIQNLVVLPFPYLFQLSKAISSPISPKLVVNNVSKAYQIYAEGIVKEIAELRTFWPLSQGLVVSQRLGDDCTSRRHKALIELLEVCYLFKFPGVRLL